MRILAGLHNAGFTDLVPAHFPVLRYPGPGDRRPSELAAEAGMTKQAMNYLLGQMQQLGYLTRDDDPDDQRFKRVRLTERGHAAAQAIRAIVADIEAELGQELGPAQFDQLRRAADPAQRHPLRPRIPPTATSNGPTTTPAGRP